MYYFFLIPEMPNDVESGLYEFERQSQGFLSKMSKIEIDPKEAATQAIHKFTSVSFFSKRKKKSDKIKTLVISMNCLRIIQLKSLKT
jgi:hypothetical protein